MPRKKHTIQTPAEFAKNRLHLKLWPKFTEIFEAVAAGERRILVRSANGVGKTTALAALCNWKLSSSEECIVLTTSSNEKQLRYNLWGEIRRQAATAGLYEDRTITDTRIKLDEKRFMVAINPAKPESAQGYHAASMMIAVDEATAVRRDILTSLIATATGDDVQIVMIYNPITPDSFVYEAERSGKWKVITISALEHPNILRKRTIISGAVTLRSTEDNLGLWSEEATSDEENAVEFSGKRWRRTVEVSRRILGQWHPDSGEGLISRALLNKSLTTVAMQGMKCMGVDLAFGGDDETVIARFDGGTQLPMRTLRTNDLELIADTIAEEYHSGFRHVAIDETGAIGSLTPKLEARRVQAYSVNFAQSPIGTYNDHYRTLGNARIEMYMHLLEELRRGELRLLDDEKMHEELAAMKLSDVSERTIYYLELKRHVKTRLGRSPDRADATALARYALLLARGANNCKFIVGDTRRSESDLGRYRSPFL